MSNMSRKLQKNTENWAVKNYYNNMTPQMYQEGIQRAIKMTEEKLTKQFNEKLARIQKNNQESVLLGMDTLATEMIYELGNVLECYKKHPTYLDQKIDIVQNIYETAMKSIEDYGSDKYKTDAEAQKVFERKRKTIQKIFGMRFKYY